MTAQDLSIITGAGQTATDAVCVITCWLNIKTGLGLGKGTDMDKKFDDGGSVSPGLIETGININTDLNHVIPEVVYHKGMSLRDRFAEQAMGSMILSHAILSINGYKNIMGGPDASNKEGLSKGAYIIADAMIAEKRRTESNQKKGN